MKEKVTKEQGKALEIYFTCHHTLKDKISIYLKESHGWNDGFLPLTEMGFDKFVRCLVNGYEVELTKEERVLQYYNDTPDVFQKIIVRNILSILDIKVKGVND
jgi:hypothetical protein